ncbi:MAG: DUF445 domain-containing protein [Actinobacteria bacterium]|nr:DUF445 domain-containing protein [Actinomycetota bacterium]
MQTLSANDLERRAGMRRMKALALGLLVFVTIVFLVARWLEEDHSWVGYIRAFAEAAMIGALADWFAVTALFRHPLGIPIPHTAIIPNRKDQIGESLGEFVQTNFLTQEVLHERLDQAHIGRRLGTWLSEPTNASKAGSAVADALRGSLEVIDDRDVGAALQGMIERKVRDTPIAPLIGRAIDVGMDGGHHQRLLDATLSGLGNFLDDNRNTFRDRLRTESPWWVPEGIDDRIFEKIYTAVHSFIGDIGRDPNHPMRRSIDERMLAFAERLKTDPGLVAKLEELKGELLEHRDVQAWLQSLWGEVKQSTLIATDDPDSELRRRIDRSLMRLGSRLVAEPELQAKVDDWVRRAAGYVVDHYRGEVADIISSTVAKWDGKATSERLELQVGRDLQFIRINGTIVGGLAGLAIYSLTQLAF